MTGEARLIQSILNEAQRQLTHTLDVDKREARLEARLLLQDVLGVQHAWLLAHAKDELDDALAARFQSHLCRRLAGEPIAYITGHREFFGLDLEVSKDTLIPRPDTETLVEAALQHIPLISSCKVLDLGTGSGAIALAIAFQRPMAEVIAVDSSPSALEVAIGNAKRLGIKNVHFIESDWFSRLTGHTFNIIVSNPPYIAENDVHL
ncbi:MAG: peptide chain release factor N(5)-glutamine methyltransferase, partial [Nitrosomonadales bacterium]|nr:peptide chain release factor N(5)-glutamine methyltransferase [Nitrosomonadales bacterium]